MREITRFDSSIEQVVVRLYERHDLEPILTEHGVQVLPLGLKGASASRNWPQATVLLRSRIREFNPAVVHTSLFTANMVGQLAARSMRLPVLSTFTQSGDLRLVKSYQPGASTRSAAVLRQVASLAAQSRHVRFRGLTRDATLTNLEFLGLSPDRARVIPRGVETDTPSPDPKIRQRLGLPPDAPLVVNIGRQAAQKGHLLLIDAFERVAASQAHVHLVVLGREGDETRQIQERLASSPASDRIQFLGYRSDAREILRAADVFMFSSLMEGLGTALLEAMAAAVPVVAFDIPPVREITNDGHVAYLVPVGNTGQLADATAAVLAGTVPSLVGDACRWTLEKYDIRNVARALQTYLEEMAV